MVLVFRSQLIKTLSALLVFGFALMPGLTAGVFALGAEVSDEIVAQAGSDGQDITLQIRQAQELFNQYQNLEAEFDTSLKNLYADTADIRMLKVFPDGLQESTHIPIAQYKQRIEQLMPLAKAKKDKGIYFNIEFVPLSQFVRINSKRRSLPNNEIGFVQLIVGPVDLNHPEKEWQIYEEYFETHSSN